MKSTTLALLAHYREWYESPFLGTILTNEKSPFGDILGTVGKKISRGHAPSLVHYAGCACVSSLVLLALLKVVLT